MLSYYYGGFPIHTNHMLGYREQLDPIDVRSLPKQFGDYIPHTGGSREITIVCGSTDSLRYHRYSVIDSKESFEIAIQTLDSRSNWIDGLHTGRFYYNLEKVRFHSPSLRNGELKPFLSELEYCDLSFDFDMSEYGGIRRCGCIGKDACLECLTFLDEIVSAFIQYLQDGFDIKIDCYTPLVIESRGEDINTANAKHCKEKLEGLHQIHPRHILKVFSGRRGFMSTL